MAKKRSKKPNCTACVSWLQEWAERMNASTAIVSVGGAKRYGGGDLWLIYARPGTSNQRVLRTLRDHLAERVPRGTKEHKGEA